MVCLLTRMSLVSSQNEQLAEYSYELVCPSGRSLWFGFLFPAGDCCCLHITTAFSVCSDGKWMDSCEIISSLKIIVL